MSTPAYDRIGDTCLRMHRLHHLEAIAWWDQAANMPPRGSDARAAALAEMAALLHRMHTDPALGELIEQARDEPLSEGQRANLREVERARLRATALPEDLVQRRSWRPHAASTPGAGNGRPTTGPAFSRTSARCSPSRASRPRAWPTSPGFPATTR
jgi:Zn-dependent M32 family carboxypeptidase